jgi:valyl-tRNA synthetase
MPFLTEEIWHQLSERTQDDCIIVASWPDAAEYDAEKLTEMDQILELVTNLRHARNQAQAGPKEQLDLYITTAQDQLYPQYLDIVKKLGVLKDVYINENTVDLSGSNFVSGKDEFLLQMESKLDPQQEKEQLLKELDYTKGFLASIEKKLSNQRFVDNAPEQVVANERKKQADAQAKIKALEASLSKL